MNRRQEPIARRALAVTTFLVLSIAPAAAFAEPTPQPLSDAACLRKIALDLTDKAPTDADLAAVKAGSKKLIDFADGYLNSAEFAKISYGWYRTLFPPTPAVAKGADLEEPTRIARYIIANDRDMRELVTGKYTVDTNNVSVPGRADAAGVLSTTYYMTAYKGVENRQWAGHLIKTLAGIKLAAVSTVPPEQDISPAGLAATPSCASCHIHPVFGIDPLARYRSCYGDDGLLAASCATTGASFLGRTGASLPDLGTTLAESEEWKASTVQMYWTKFFARPIGSNEVSFYWTVRDAWIASGFKPRTLIKQIVTSPQYCAR